MRVESTQWRFQSPQRGIARSRAVVLIISSFTWLAAAGCDEEYTECHPERAPSDFPDAEDREARCAAVCEHFATIGCNLGCPHVPDGGLDAGLETSEIDCALSCLYATDTTTSSSDLDDEAVDRVMRCYAGADTCLQVGACSRLCGDDGVAVWPNDDLCLGQ